MTERVTLHHFKEESTQEVKTCDPETEIEWSEETQQLLLPIACLHYCITWINASKTLNWNQCSKSLLFLLCKTIPIDLISNVVPALAMHSVRTSVCTAHGSAAVTSPRPLPWPAGVLPFAYFMHVAILNYRGFSKPNCNC